MLHGGFLLEKGGRMYYKPDWPKAKERMIAWWKGEIIDRCCIAVTSPRKGSNRPPYPSLMEGPHLVDQEGIADNDMEAIKSWWADPETVYKRMITWFENTYWGGEAIPRTYLNWGASAMCGFFGSEPQFTKKTVWYPKIITDWKTFDLKVDFRSSWTYRRIIEITKLFVERCNERYFVGVPESGNVIDDLSLMRGMEELVFDMMGDVPDAILRSIMKTMGKVWIDYHETIYNLTYECNDHGGVLPWMGTWAPGRHDQMACDFSSLLSPTLFNKWVVFEIKEIYSSWCEYRTYHLDGPDALKHLDTLISLPEIHTIQWTPGAGNPTAGSGRWIPYYKRIQAAGKNLFLIAPINDVEALLTQLSPNGLFICTQADSEEEAKDLLKKVEKWSANGNIFSVS